MCVSLMSTRCFNGQIHNCSRQLIIAAVPTNKQTELHTRRNNLAEQNVKIIQYERTEYAASTILPA